MDSRKPPPWASLQRRADPPAGGVLEHRIEVNVAVKPKIHPEWFETQVTCACGETFTSYSTKKLLRVEICSKCHPLFTGKHKIVDTEGRVEKFISKYKKGSPSPRNKKKVAAEF